MRTKASGIDLYLWLRTPFSRKTRSKSPAEILRVLALKVVVFLLENEEKAAACFSGGTIFLTRLTNSFGRSEKLDTTKGRITFTFPQDNPAFLFSSPRLSCLGFPPRHLPRQHDIICVMKKSGIVALVGRPNTGKSTLLNNLIGTKVSITSPKPQTTRFPIRAVFNDERGQVIFIDTPGIFEKAKGPVVSLTNQKAYRMLNEEVDLILYLVDKTRPKGAEENKILGLLRKIDKPKILVINKMDVPTPDFSADFEFLKEEFPEFISVSALKEINLRDLLTRIFAHLPERELLIDESTPSAALNLDRKMFIEEIIREKAFLNTRDEVPYFLTTAVEEIAERRSGSLYVKALILVADKRYKGMLIGRGGKTIKEIGQAVRKELEVSTNRRVFVDLTVETDPHWMDRLT